MSSTNLISKSLNASEEVTKKKLTYDLSDISLDRIENHKIVINSIISELDKLKRNLSESRDTIQNNNTLNLGSTDLSQNAINITNSFNVLNILIGIYRISDFSQESIENTKQLLLSIQGQVNNTVGKTLESEISEANLGGGGWSKRNKASRKKNRKY
jgi:hypothetical protein